MNEFASVDQAYMDGASLRVGIFKKEKWYEFHAQVVKYNNITETHNLLLYVEWLIKHQ